MGRGSSKHSRNQSNEKKSSFARDWLTSVVLLDLLLYGPPGQRAARERREAEKRDGKSDPELDLIVGIICFVVMAAVVIGFILLVRWFLNY